MDWIFCADDWGVHVSTTQHLASEMAKQDRVIWINSIGMRAPSFTVKDFRRLRQKFLMLHAQEKSFTRHSLEPAPMYVVHPQMLPWHLNKCALAASRVSFGHQMKSVISRFGFKEAVVLTINPMLVRHLYFPHRHLVYLRLDDYARLPGVDSEMVHICEAEIYEKAEIIFYTARLLAPPERWQGKSHFLPQAIDAGHFDAVPLKPPRTKILGFFGLLAEWLDDQLIEQVARACPDWTLEFVGPRQYLPERLDGIPNVRILAPVSYNELPAQVSRWDAAWVPFRITELTRQVNPLKLREYLAAGLPTLCTPLPDARDLLPHIHLVSNAEEVRDRLQEISRTDNEEQRKIRRESVRDHTWTARAGQVRSLVSELK